MPATCCHRAHPKSWSRHGQRSRPRPLRSPAAVLVCRAEKDDKSADKSAPKDDAVTDTVRELRKASVDQATAREILDLWKKNGVTDDPEELRKLYKKRGNVSLLQFGLQLLLDAGGAYASYSAGQAVLAGPDFFGRGVLAFLIFAVSFNAALSFGSNSISMVISIRAMSRFGTNAAAYLRAMKEIAGAGGSLDAVGKVMTAYDAIKVEKALEDIDAFLKGHSTANAGERGAATMDALSAYLTLVTAQERFGFKQADYGLSDDAAAGIAATFARYDTNDDYKLDLNEFETLCDDAGRTLTREEAKAALSALDADGNGYIEFPEFVQFWVNPKESVRKLSEKGGSEKGESSDGGSVGSTEAVTT